MQTQKLDFWSLRADCTIPTNSSNSTTRITSYVYDFDGHLTQVNGPEGVINYEYDQATGRQIRTCSLNSDIRYQYDILGRLWKVSVVKRNGATVSPSEDTVYTYTPVGNRSTVALPNGIGSTWQYDSLNRLTNLTHKLGGTNLISSYSYQLHGTGRRTNAIEILKIPDNEGGGYLTNTLSWSYDQMYRLTNEVSISSAAANAGTFTNSFQYDKVGNRWSSTHYQNGTSTTVTNLYNANDQLVREVTVSGGSANSTNWYAYDSNGSVVGKTNISSSGSTVLYGYDLKNKLSSATTVGTGTTNYFGYDLAGIRVKSWLSSGGNPTLYLVDENNHTGYAQVFEELTALGGGPTRSYVIGDDVLGQSSGSSASYLLYDGHGSTRQLSSALGAVTSRYNFDAYGTRLDSSTSVANEIANNSFTSLLYCGEQFDSNLGMYNLRARYYSPSIGRFTARDTFVGHNGDPQSLHKYTYANCDPATNVDPSGNYAIAAVAVVVAAIAVLVAIGLTVYSGIRHGKSAGAIALDVIASIAAFFLIAVAILGSGAVAIISTVFLVGLAAWSLINLALSWSEMDPTDKRIAIGLLLCYLVFGGAVRAGFTATSVAEDAPSRPGVYDTQYTQGGRVHDVMIQVRSISDSSVKAEQARNVSSHDNLARVSGLSEKPGLYGVTIERVDGRPVTAVVGSDAFPELTDAQWEQARAEVGRDTGLRPEQILRHKSIRRK